MKQKWTTASWTQDNTNLSYQQNPRVTETNIYDAAGNRRRATISYASFTLPSGASCSLPTDTYEYQSDATTVYRRSHTDYNIDTPYLNLRIIGLVNGSYLYDGAGNVMSKATYCYDCDSTQIANTPAAPVQHDATYDSTDLSIKRGNLMVEGRWDASDPQNAAKQLYRHWRYDTAGNLIAITDPLNHQQSISYSDSFSESSRNGNKFAYPTELKDAENKSIYTQYNYDFGAATRVTTPSPNAGQAAPYQTYTYDTAGRLTQITNGVNQAYTRWSYSTNWRDIYTYSTIQDGAGEVWSLNARNGAGATWASVDELPNGYWALSNSMASLR